MSDNKEVLTEILYELRRSNTLLQIMIEKMDGLSDSIENSVTDVSDVEKKLDDVNRHLADLEIICGRDKPIPED